MTPLPDYLSNHEAVVSAYGYWPSFHDGEIISLRMDRERILHGEICNPRIELAVHGWEMTSEVDVKGFFVHKKRHLVHFVFDEVADVIFDGFNHQNAVMGLSFEELPHDASGNRIFRTVIASAFGLGGEFLFRRGEVLSVVPCDQNGAVLP